MIPFIIILALVLIALLIDWTWVKQRLQGLKATRQKLPKKPRLQNTRAAFDTEITSEEPAAVARSVQPKPSSPEVSDLLEKADIAFRKGELDQAEQLYLKAAAKDPKCSKAYSRLGVIYLENSEDYTDAEEAFRQALKYDAGNGYILNNLGLVLYHQDRYAEAVRNFEAAVRIDEGNSNRHANLGKAYMAMRQYAKAESCFKKAMKITPNELEYKDLMDEALEKKLAHKALVRR